MVGFVVWCISWGFEGLRVCCPYAFFIFYVHIYLYIYIYIYIVNSIKNKENNFILFFKNMKLRTLRTTLKTWRMITKHVFCFQKQKTVFKNTFQISSKTFFSPLFFFLYFQELNMTWEKNKKKNDTSILIHRYK